MVKNDPKVAAKALISFRGKYLLMLRSDKEKIMPSAWDIPGGGVEKKETLLDALIREIKEETGVDFSSSKFFPIKKWALKKGKIKISGIDFLCILEKYQKIKLSPEHTQAKWFSKEEIIKSKKIPTWLKESVILAEAKINHN